MMSAKVSSQPPLAMVAVAVAWWPSVMPANTEARPAAVAPCDVARESVCVFVVVCRQG